jgi:hypothetical protein
VGCLPSLWLLLVVSLAAVILIVHLTIIYYTRSGVGDLARHEMVVSIPR